MKTKRNASAKNLSAEKRFEMWCDGKPVSIHATRDEADQAGMDYMRMIWRTQGRTPGYGTIEHKTEAEAREALRAAGEEMW